MDERELTIIALIVAGAAIYFIPTMIAVFRGHKNQTAILVLNIFLGWALVGWVVALVWAVLSDQEERRRRTYSRNEPTPFDQAPPPATFVYACPHCGKPVQVAAAFVGLTVACGSCNRHFTATPVAPPA